MNLVLSGVRYMARYFEGTGGIIITWVAVGSLAYESNMRIDKFEKKILKIHTKIDSVHSEINNL